MVFSTSSQFSIQQMFDKESVPSTLLFYGPKQAHIPEAVLFFATKLLGSSSKLAQNSHPDYHVYRPDEKSNLHSMATIKEILEEMKLPPFEASKKLFVIYDADAMLPSSSNALLKALEEAQENTYTILVTHHLETILPTIRSRSRLLSFFSNAEENLKSHPLASPLLEILTGQHYLDYVVFVKSLAELEHRFDENQQDQQIDIILTLLLYWYRDLSLLKSGADPQWLYYPEHINALNTQKIPLSLDRIFTELSEAKEAFNRGVKLRTLLCNFFNQIR